MEIQDFIRYLPTDDNSGLGIPFKTKEGSTGIMEYFDLKRHPELIPTVRELRDHSELQQFVAKLNEPTSLFRTLRCEFPCTCSPSDPGIFQTHWHFTFAFELVEHNHPDAYDIFNKLLDEYLHRSGKQNVLAFDLRKVHTSYRDHGVTLLSQDIETYGIGRSDEESKTHLTIGLNLLGDFFAAESKKWANELTKGRPTIS